MFRTLRWGSCYWLGRGWGWLIFNFDWRLSFRGGLRRSWRTDQGSSRWGCSWKTFPGNWLPAWKRRRCCSAGWSASWCRAPVAPISFISNIKLKINLNKEKKKSKPSHHWENFLLTLPYTSRILLFPLSKFSIRKSMLYYSFIPFISFPFITEFTPVYLFNTILSPPLTIDAFVIGIKLSWTVVFSSLPCLSSPSFSILPINTSLLFLILYYSLYRCGKYFWLPCWCWLRVGFLPIHCPMFYYLLCYYYINIKFEMHNSEQYQKIDKKCELKGTKWDW